MATHTTALLLARLKAWKESAVGSTLCLDLRSASEYKKNHLAPSTNIPWPQLSLRCAELPPKRTPFAVVEPLETQGCSSWLQEQGWQCPWVFWEGDCSAGFWTAARQAGWASDANDTPSDLPKPWLLFRPCPFLAQHIDRIERDLGSHHSALACLDIGCGSGRDAAWLLSRPIGSWRVTAVDSLKHALQRTEALTTHLGVRDRLDHVVHAKIMADGAWKSIDTDKPAMPAILTQQDKETEPCHDTKQHQFLKKKATFSPGIPTSEFFGQLSSSSSFSPSSRTATSGYAKYDLILTIRFLVRSLLPQLPDLLNIGGFLVISHFVDDGSEYDQPRKDHRLAVGELSSLYGSMAHMEVVMDVIETIEDGRPVNSVIIRKTREKIDD
ncbi:uncharacterized protein BYT42DRAFT_612282 [Radiomyces spectabilis]|uniref:uncharacterized protein n=1 Tax=Radiomyces spectabilis TaxID=64574 RepID=UPI00221E3C36|nr:uncharacterized protein BYT42DRAFT_612282 [Radiomyces spectabilis]KAI8384593.1 hypothetical protein BYT42DRAFT_612282 [Radiomyces spectabilis]